MTIAHDIHRLSGTRPQRNWPVGQDRHEHHALRQSQNPAAPTRAGCLLGAFLLAGVLAAHAQLIKPEVIVSFVFLGPKHPFAGLTLGNDGNFYGTTLQGGSSGFGTVFKVATDGTLTTLVSFDDANGKYPQAALALDNDGVFYGTTQQGGTGGAGTVFRVTTNGTFNTLVSFNNANGASPAFASPPLTHESAEPIMARFFEGTGKSFSQINTRH